MNQRLVLLGEYMGTCSAAACMTIASLPVPGTEQRSEVRACVWRRLRRTTCVTVRAYACREPRCACVWPWWPSVQSVLRPAAAS